LEIPLRKELDEEEVADFEEHEVFEIILTQKLSSTNHERRFQASFISENMHLVGKGKQARPQSEVVDISFFSLKTLYFEGSAQI
jgi:hypothetical protein